MHLDGAELSEFHLFSEISVILPFYLISYSMAKSVEREAQSGVIIYYYFVSRCALHGAVGAFTVLIYRCNTRSSYNTCELMICTAYA